MTIEKRLQQFYIDNNLPNNGGVDKNTFRLKVFGINWKFPNPQFRKDIVHIHDIQHILNDCDTSWKGETYISGWELSTGMWKHFPVCLFSFWAAGYGVWMYPKALFTGYKKGVNDIGIIDIKLNKSDFMKMTLDQLKDLVSKKEKTTFGMVQWLQFLFWLLISEILFLTPFVIGIILIISLIK
ncbi:hypothetical protein RQM59_12785 [Flavobacteriaceae bacterium S356]|uniref:Uncharacterized protein n=1 Tax=Asprobacillus argus TaxID=3076534 RepID=A0ABU3LIF6_9FLAO|nr:hypothetical protein [Flavobacteriaceae bacterium S356]